MRDPNIRAAVFLRAPARGAAGQERAAAGPERAAGADGWAPPGFVYPEQGAAGWPARNGHRTLAGLPHAARGPRRGVAVRRGMHPEFRGVRGGPDGHDLARWCSMLVRRSFGTDLHLG